MQVAAAGGPDMEANMNWKNWLAALALWCAAGASGAVGHTVDVAVYDRSAQRPLPVYHHEGRWYIEGRPGSEYEIRLNNRAAGDVLAVISVDGVNVVTGETAHWRQTGYVLDSGRSHRIPGWRKSTERVAAFFFTSHRRSYAARTGRPDDVGVIGVAVFHRRSGPPGPIEPFDREEDPYPGERDDAHAGKAEPQAGARVESPARRRARSLGTGHGRRLASRVRYTSFERATVEPAEIIAIHYDSRSNLVAMGVIPTPRYAQPSPFPGGFVPDP